MKYVKLGKHGVKVSPLCLGTMNFGWKTTEEDSFKIMDRAVATGINFFDTADIYGRWSTHAGACEEIIGRWFGQGGSRRESVVLATKVFNPTGKEDANEEPNHNTPCYSAMKIIRHCEDSLRRLKTDRIDLYQLHHIDRECPMDELWEAMETLKRQGKIIYVGSSNFAGWDIAHACMAARMRNQVGLVSEQSVYNLDNRMVELEVIPACREFGLGLIPWSPLAGGFLGGKFSRDKDGRRDEGMKDLPTGKVQQLEKFEDLCESIGEKPADVALAWLLHNPVVTAPIIGPRTMEQFEGSLKSLEISLTAETIKQLDEIFPGPGGEAPKAYAW